MAEYSALTIAKWFSAWAEEVEQAHLTNLKLQKLLYYAQGHHLAWAGAPLFREDLQAWSHGPVVPEVYRAFKDFGSEPIRLPESDPFSWADVDETTAQFLMKVWNTYGGFAAWRPRHPTAVRRCGPVHRAVLRRAQADGRRSDRSGPAHPVDRAGVQRAVRTFLIGK